VAAPSLLIKQHIGSIEKKINAFSKKPEIKPLIAAGCVFTDGVTMIDPYTGFQYTPYAVTGNLGMLTTIPEIRRISTIYNDYITYIKVLDQDEVRYAMELPAMRERLREALIDEHLVRDGKLWTHTADEGVFMMEIVTRSQTAVTYHKWKGKEREAKVSKGYFQRMELFLSYEEAMASYRRKKW